MHSTFAQAYPQSLFDNPDPFRRPKKVQSFPILPIEVPPDYSTMQIYSLSGGFQPSSYVDPALLSDVPPDAFPPSGSYIPYYDNATIPPALLQFGDVHFDDMQALDFAASSMGTLMDRPSSEGSSSSSNKPYGFSRRSDGFIQSHAPSKSMEYTNVNNEPYFCRTPNATLRQRTAQACEKCRDRKTKCSGTRPVCKRCADRGLTCEWAPETRVRGQSRVKPGRLSPSDNDGEPIEALPHPVSSSSLSSIATSAMDLEANDDDTPIPITKRAPAAFANDSGSTSAFRPKHGASSSMSGSHTKAATAVAAQRMSWPMGPPAARAQASPVRKMASFVDAVPSAVDFAEDDSWGSVWANGKPEEPVIDAAPVPGRLFDFSSSVLNSFDQGSSDGSRDSSRPSSVSNTHANNSIDGLHEFLGEQMQLSAADEAAFTAEMYNLLNLPPSETSLSSSSSSSESAEVSLDNLQDFAVAAVANGGDIDDQVTPIPGIVQAKDENVMEQFLSDDFYTM